MNTWQRPWDEPMIAYKEYAIGGKLVTVSVRVADDVMMNQFSDERARQVMRQKLCEDLAAAMLSQKLVEINSMKNPLDLSTTIVARAYLAPDSNVKLLRTLDLR